MWWGGHRQNAEAAASLTVSAVEQDLDTFPQRVDVLGLPDERIPFLCKKTGAVSVRRNRSRSGPNLLHLLNINLGNEHKLLIGLASTSW